MKIEVAERDLHSMREIIWEGRAYYSRIENPCTLNYERVQAGTKMIKRINAALKKAHGHDCCGDHYL